VKTELLQRREATNDRLVAEELLEEPIPDSSYLSRIQTGVSKDLRNLTIVRRFHKQGQ
jgi:hypothetical protein